MIYSNGTDISRDQNTAWVLYSCHVTYREWSRDMRKKKFYEDYDIHKKTIMMFGRSLSAIATQSKTMFSFCGQAIGLAGRGPTMFVRTAMKSSIKARKPGSKNPAGKRLGVKRFHGEYVRSGEIIVRQRGSKFHNGDHVYRGSDFTLTSQQCGYVHFYKNPLKPKRKYVGIVFHKDDKLPYQPQVPHNRRLGLLEVTGQEFERDKLGHIVPPTPPTPSVEEGVWVSPRSPMRLRIRKSYNIGRSRTRPVIKRL